MKDAILPPAPSKAADPSLTPLIASFDDQKERFSRAFDILHRAIEEKSFPGASVAITHRGALVALQGLGHFTYEANSTPVTAETIYDLASVSKVLATTAMAMLLYQQGRLDLDAPVTSIFPDFGSSAGRKRVTLRMLLTHSSGLPGYERLYLKARNREEMLAMALRTPLPCEPGTHAEYSDIGFIILGAALEKLAAEPLDAFCHRRVFDPLELRHTRFNPPAAWRERIAPTVNDTEFRKRLIQGEVHDENASVMGGIAGHAGLFATARDVASYAHCMLSAGVPLFQRETVKLFTTCVHQPPGNSAALGWDTPSKPSQSGKYFSGGSFGHLGYTGTSLWCDPVRNVSVTLLTNRTWPDCRSDAIKQVRPAFHDAVIEALDRA